MANSENNAATLFEIERFTLNRSVPNAVMSPASESECAGLIKEAAERGLPIVPWGGGTAIRQGNPIRATEWAVISTACLTGEIEFSPADMVVTAPAGTTLDLLQATVESSNQFLPIDHAFPERATLGGIVAANEQGLLRGAYGLPRDRLLGLRVVLADGSRVNSGGKVVKNVAGYDLNKLFAGSWGTLGLITEVTFQTNPRPESTLHLNFRAESLESAALAALQVRGARLDASYLVAGGPTKPVLSVGLMGGAETTEWQAQRIAELLTEHGLSSGGVEPTAESLRIEWEEADRIRARFSVCPSDMPVLLRALSEYRIAVRAQLSVGVADIAFDDPSLVPALDRLRPERGHLVWTNMPDSAGGSVQDVWGPVKGDFHIMRAVKDALDPRGIFSPGRFVGGI